MKLIKPTFEILKQEPGLQGIYKIIEQAGRTCYKSEAFITNDSAEKFVKMIIDRGHTAMLEHGTVYLTVTPGCNSATMYTYAHIVSNYERNKYSHINDCFEGGKYKASYITTNYRVLVENNWLGDLKFLCEPTEFHEKRISVKFICDRGVSHEFVRHRVFSFAQESTRYCNYSKDKFGNELTFIIPPWMAEHHNFKNSDINESAYGVMQVGDSYSRNYIWLSAIQESENTYLSLLSAWEDRQPDKRYRTGFKSNPWTPQQARSVLPNSLKTELVMTGTTEQWKGFFKLRTAKDAHPQAQELAVPLRNFFENVGYI